MKKHDDIDYMEIGDTGLVPLPDGWFLERYTGYTISPDGIVFDKDGEVFYDPFENEYNEVADDEYDWY